MESNPSTESNIKQQMESNRQYENAMRENKATIEHRETKNLKELLTNRYGSTEQQYNSGHGVCGYMGATHSSQHKAPDAKHSSTRCFSTHEMWELPTPLILANRSQQGDEVRELPAQPLTASWVPSNTYLTPNELPKRQKKSDAYVIRLHKGDVFAHLSSFTQASKSSTKRSVLARGVQRYHSYFNQSCLPSAIGEDKVR
ncbi:wall-associated receptor kinase-like 15-like [Dorcoceras hygrometricum]|uniref:Wall-associated receptor kinase-like 15-like n=1 Tax=Dorcoceras hygrometricum TaxID=472368 RepID=A0A2Z7AGJ2_9LAMI|nr:wall-associated receptor kinase-like 15-like [Dorcoceras hygrometricum]